jgi:hypothetical protein
MRNIFLSIASLIILFFAACGTTYETNKQGFEQINTELKEHFGANAWYTSISYSKGGEGNSGYLLAVDKTDEPQSLRQEKWVRIGSSWEKAANVTLDIKNGKPEDYMFQLDKEISLPTLGGLVESSIQKLKDDKKIDNASLKLAIVSTNHTILSKQDKINYTVILDDSDGENSYSFTYNLKGELINSNY